MIGRRFAAYPALHAALDALPGWGRVTVRLFLRELRGVWPEPARRWTSAPRPPHATSGCWPPGQTERFWPGWRWHPAWTCATSKLAWCASPLPIATVPMTSWHAADPPGLLTVNRCPPELSTPATISSTSGTRLRSGTNVDWPGARR